KIDNFSGVARFDFVEHSNINNAIFFDRDRAVLDRRSIHRHNEACADNHFSAVANIGGNNATLAERRCRASALSPFTTLRHSATSKLHASWQSSGITGAVVAGVANPD